MTYIIYNILSYAMSRSQSTWLNLLNYVLCRDFAGYSDYCSALGLALVVHASGCLTHPLKLVNSVSHYALLRLSIA